MASLVSVGDLGTVFSSIGNLIQSIRSAITGKLDPEAQAELEAKLLDIQSQAQLVQNQINLAEAANPNLFVSGWRPFVGWVCGMGLVYAYVAMPLLQWAAKAINPSIPDPPAINTGEMIPLLMSLLGLGGLRTFEKVQGVARG